MRRLILSLAFAPLLLTACTIGQMRAKQAQESAKVVCAQAAADPVLDPIRGQVPTDARQASFSQLSDERKVRPDQKPAVEAITAVYAQCADASARYLELAYGGNVAVMYGSLQNDLKLTELALWSEQITFGQFNTLRSKLVYNFLQSAQTVATRDAIAAAQVQAQQAQAAAAIMSTLPRYQPPATVNTNCYKSGNSVNCTTY